MDKITMISQLPAQQQEQGIKSMDGTAIDPQWLAERLATSRPTVTKL